MKKLLTIALLAGVLVTTGCSSTTSNPDELVYRDASYRGTFYDGSVEVDFTLKDNKFESIKFRKLAYKGVDYQAEDAADSIKGIAGQYTALIDHLVGKDVSEVEALYTPADIAEDADSFSAATIRSGKVISAINDALNRGAYSLPKE